MLERCEQIIKEGDKILSLTTAKEKIEQIPKINSSIESIYNLCYPKGIPAHLISEVGIFEFRFKIFKGFVEDLKKGLITSDYILKNLKNEEESETLKKLKVEYEKYNVKTNFITSYHKEHFKSYSDSKIKKIDELIFTASREVVKWGQKKKRAISCFIEKTDNFVNFINYNTGEIIDYSNYKCWKKD